MATSVTARGKIILAAKKGESIPEGLAIDPDGRPTTDAKLALAGAVLPFGGHKGSAMPLLVEVLSAVLAGASMAPHVGNLYDNPTGVQDIGHELGAIRIEAFAPLAELTARMDQLIREARQSPRAQGADHIYMPGEIECDNAARNAARGLALPDVTVEDLRLWGERLGVAWPFAGTNVRSA
jgi:LDH2 family malate/lactate/ureidoglycolate dehydrogenase